MERLRANIGGDRVVWVLTGLLVIVSALTVYSASSGLAFTYYDGNLSQILFKHVLFAVIGMVLMFAVHRIPLKYFRNLSLIMVPVVIGLLSLTLIMGQTIGDANASRWIKIPFVPIGFQPSELAKIALILFLARFLSKYRDNLSDFKKVFYKAVLPIAFVCGLILPANLSTAALIFVVAGSMLFIGGVPFKHMLAIAGIGVAILGLFILTVLAFPGISNRVDTWKSRIERFAEGDPSENYQVTKAKTAIATGGITGKGPGKSQQKYFLPQSSSDFIYAVVIEEYGLVGGVVMWLLYVFLFIRFLMISSRVNDAFGRLLVIGFTISLAIQTTINMGVAVNIFPVTGQTLPLVSSGGSSMWMTFITLGIILSVSRWKGEEMSENDGSTEKEEEYVTA